MIFKAPSNSNYAVIVWSMIYLFAVEYNYVLEPQKQSVGDFLYLSYQLCVILLSLCS